MSGRAILAHLRTRKGGREVPEKLLRQLEALTYAWQPLADLPGAENAGSRVNEYDTLVHLGRAERKVETLRTESGRAYGSRFLYRVRLTLRPGALTVDLTALPEVRQVGESRFRTTERGDGAGLVCMRLSLGGGTDIFPQRARTLEGQR